MPKNCRCRRVRRVGRRAKCELAHGQAWLWRLMLGGRRGLPPSRRPPSAVPTVRPGRAAFVWAGLDCNAIGRCAWQAARQIDRRGRVRPNRPLRVKVDDVAGGAPAGKVPARLLLQSRRAPRCGIIDVVEQIEPDAEQVTLLGNAAHAFGGRLAHACQTSGGTLRNPCASASSRSDRAAAFTRHELREHGLDSGMRGDPPRGPLLSGRVGDHA